MSLQCSNLVNYLAIPPWQYTLTYSTIPPHRHSTATARPPPPYPKLSPPIQGYRKRAERTRSGPEPTPQPTSDSLLRSHTAHLPFRRRTQFAVPAGTTPRTFASLYREASLGSYHRTHTTPHDSSPRLAEPSSYPSTTTTSQPQPPRKTKSSNDSNEKTSPATSNNDERSNSGTSGTPHHPPTPPTQPSNRINPNPPETNVRKPTTEEHPSQEAPYLEPRTNRG